MHPQRSKDQLYIAHIIIRGEIIFLSTLSRKADNF